VTITLLLPHIMRAESTASACAIFADPYRSVASPVFCLPPMLLLRLGLLLLLGLLLALSASTVEASPTSSP